jgi:hypothetical protein
MKGQPLAYNKDNQEDKEPLFDTADTVIDTLRIYADMMGGIRVKPEAMRAALSQGYATATDLADYLVKKGLPFRDAHEAVARAVRAAEQGLRPAADLSLRRHGVPSRRRAPGDDVFAVLTVEGSLPRATTSAAPRPSRCAPRSARARLRREHESTREVRLGSAPSFRRMTCIRRRMSASASTNPPPLGEGATRRYSSPGPLHPARSGDQAPAPRIVPKDPKRGQYLLRSCFLNEASLAGKLPTRTSCRSTMRWSRRAMPTGHGIRAGRHAGADIRPPATLLPLRARHRDRLQGHARARLTPSTRASPTATSNRPTSC